MKKNEAIKLLNSEGWTKADAQRALESIDFDTNPDELIIRRAASKFAGTELINRQRSQAVQKRLVTKKTNEIQKYLNQIEELERNLAKRPKELSDENIELKKANQSLQRDNKDLKNIVDAIRLKLTIETKYILKLKNIGEVKQSLVKLLNSTLG